MRPYLDAKVYLLLKEASMGVIFLFFNRNSITIKIFLGAFQQGLLNEKCGGIL